jgi:hypothetical protein
MLKLKNACIVLSLLIFGLTSCSKDDSTPTPTSFPIEGKWQFTKDGTITNNQEVLSDYQHTLGCTKDYIEILAGNILKLHFFENNATTNCVEFIDIGTWTRNNNSFVLSFVNEPNVNSEILQLTSTTLKIKFDLSGVTDVLVFTKIP